MARQRAIIIDRDGSAASVAYTAPADRSGEAWRNFNASMPFDAPVPVVVALVRAVRPGVARIMVSGRMEGDHPGDRRRRFAMLGWLAKHELPIDELFMREGGDTRSDAVVKTEIYQRFIEPVYDVRVVVDDRPEVIAAWRALGLTVIAVSDPGILPPIALQAA